MKKRIEYSCSTNMPYFICFILLPLWTAFEDTYWDKCCVLSKDTKERIHYIILELYLPVLISVQLQHLTVSIFYTTHRPCRLSEAELMHYSSIPGAFAGPHWSGRCSLAGIHLGNTVRGYHDTLLRPYDLIHRHFMLTYSKECRWILA